MGVCGTKIENAPTPSCGKCNPSNMWNALHVVSLEELWASFIVICSSWGSSGSRKSTKHLWTTGPVVLHCEHVPRWTDTSHALTSLSFISAVENISHKKNRLRASRTLFRCVGFHHLPPGDDHAASTTKSELLSRKVRLPHQRCAWPCFHPILRRRRDHAGVKFTIYKMALRFLPLKQPRDWGGKSQESLEPLPTDRSGLSI